MPWPKGKPMPPEIGERLQRVGMPRGVQPVRRHEWRPKWWVIAAGVSLALWALWGVLLAVVL